MLETQETGVVWGLERLSQSVIEAMAVNEIT